MLLSIIKERLQLQLLLYFRKFHWYKFFLKGSLGAIFILRKDIGVGGPENWNFPLLYVVKMSLRRWVGGSKKPQNTLT